MDVNGLRQAIKTNNFEWRKNSLLRMIEKQIKQSTVIEVILEGEIIEDHPDDFPYPSCLMFKIVTGIPYHVVVAFNEPLGKAYIITAYIPSRDKFESNYKTRNTT